MDVPSDTANVVWQYPEAAELFLSLARDREVREETVTAAGRNPLYAGTVRVRVLDGTGTPGLAEEVAGSLRGYGFTVAGTGSADAAGAGTSVVHPAGLARQARALASRLPGSTVTESADAPEGLVTLTVGRASPAPGEPWRARPRLRGTRRSGTPGAASATVGTAVGTGRAAPSRGAMPAAAAGPAAPRGGRAPAEHAPLHYPQGVYTRG
ncbi:LytR C-terminal domain-containing protein [Streptomyces sp. I6]|uniref:LytR C-terminal domain-containing protein n=1 Tax=Streptomyces sp. I6 TaxID=2483113 RepID=UPI0037DA0BD4